VEEFFEKLVVAQNIKELAVLKKTQGPLLYTKEPAAFTLFNIILPDKARPPKLYLPFTRSFSVVNTSNSFHKNSQYVFLST